MVLRSLSGDRRANRVGRECRGQRRLMIEALEPRYLLAAFDILAFTKTTGFRHSSIEAGVAALEALGAAHDFSVTHTENASAFNAANLANFEAVVFLNTTGNVLNSTQQAAFQAYIRNGGGYAGVHSATDTERGWAWYGDLVGAFQLNHPPIQQATVVVADGAHPSTANLPERWVRTDEWYNFQINPRGDVHVLATLDESTYNPGNGAHGHDHPISWYQYFEGGRSWYTGLGHTSSSYSEPLFLDHLLGGIQFAAGRAPADQGATVEANWQKVVLDGDTLDPMELEVAPNGDVFYIERGGKLKIYHPTTDTTTVAGQLDVFSDAEDGLLGMALDPNFAQNNWIYLFYSPEGGNSIQRLSRFTMNGDTLDSRSQKLLLQFPLIRSCCHSGGSLAFGPDGTLYLSTGDNTNPFASQGYTPIDEQPGRQLWDAQKSASNTNDLRGKILRIQPEDDGTYSIPDGNLFPSDGSQGRPEIFVMGNRNPFRISVDQETGWLYWGEVGPDSNTNSATRGPRGHDEINQARGPGNYGWPYITADNKPYRDFDFATGTSGSLFNPAAPVNDSPNNTGATNLPPAAPAFIWYTDATSNEFPELGSGGGRTAMAGPVYHFDPDLDSDNKLPAYFDNTLFIYEWSRRWIKEVKLDDSGNILKINPFAENLSFKRPMDMELGPDGALYMLEWGSRFQGGPENTDSKLVRVDFIGNLPRLVGDYNGNGTVDAADYTVWRDALGTVGDSPADGDRDGFVNEADYNLWKLNFGQTITTAGANSAAPPAAPLAESVDREPTTPVAVDRALLVTELAALPVVDADSSVPPRASDHVTRPAEIDGDLLLLLARRPTARSESIVADDRSTTDHPADVGELFARFGTGLDELFAARGELFELGGDHTRDDRA